MTSGRESENRLSERERGRWVTGMLLIVLGVLLLVGRLDLIDSWHMHGLWPLLLIALGIGRFWSRPNERRRGAGLGLAFVGVIFLLDTQGVMSLEDSWPLFIVGAGLSVLAGARGGRRDASKEGAA